MLTGFDESGTDLVGRAAAAIDHGRPEVCMELLASRDTAALPDRLRLRRLWAVAALRRAQVVEARGELQLLIDEALSAERPVAVTDARAVLAHLQHVSGNTADACVDLIGAMNLASELMADGHTGHDMATCLNTIGYCWLHMGGPEPAITYFRQARDHAPDAGRLMVMVRLNALEARVQTMRRSWRERRPIPSESIDAAADLVRELTADDHTMAPRFRIEVRTFEAIVRLLTGDLDAALLGFERAAADLELVTDDKAVAGLHLWWATALRLGGEPEAALEHGAVALRHSHQPQGRAQANLELALACKQLGRFEQACEAFEAADREADTSPGAPLAAAIEKLTSQTAGASGPIPVDPVVGT
ncbi:MAG: tol-pal system YbgF family protein [Acidimicrobiales bacterium]